MSIPVRSTLAVLAAAALLSGCSVETDTAAPATEATAPPATTNDAATAPTMCYPASPIKDPELSAFAAVLQLPPDAQVVTGRVSTDSDHPGEVGVALDLCVPDSSSADALRPIATDIATVLKSTPLGQRTFALYVADMGPEYDTEAKLKDGDFQLHLWNGNPSRSAELARWEVVTG
ncbi:hypothetical protein [Nocardia brevicatena]|uniref:hypothetical protein n=1 Tax=Nocardia brevicatena TaxID=37327 RepID=UPI0002D560F9|nr:hypothetical protein [Nocardia brevicatena]